MPTTANDRIAVRPFDVAQALSNREAVGVKVSGKGFAFPGGCGDAQLDALFAIGTEQNAFQVMALAEARR